MVISMIKKMTKKMTKKEMFAQIIEQFELSAEQKAFLEHEIELLEKKSGGNRKPTATQKANEGIKSAILDYMEPEVLYSISDISKNVPECAELSGQKISAIITLLKNAELVERVEVKRKAFFKKKC